MARLFEPWVRNPVPIPALFSAWSAPDSRLWSGSLGSSTLMTSAPRTPSWYAANGPASTWVQSRTLIPSNGRILSPYLGAVNASSISTW